MRTSLSVIPNIEPVTKTTDKKIKTRPKSIGTSEPVTFPTIKLKSAVKNVSKEILSSIKPP
jgi:hypothetical protein